MTETTNPTTRRLTTHHIIAPLFPVVGLALLTLAIGTSPAETSKWTRMQIYRMSSSKTRRNGRKRKR